MSAPAWPFELAPWAGWSSAQTVRDITSDITPFPLLLSFMLETSTSCLQEQQTLASPAQEGLQ